MPPGEVNEDIFECRRMRTQLGQRNTLSSKFVKKPRHGPVQFRNLKQHIAVFRSYVANAGHPADTG